MFPPIFQLVAASGAATGLLGANPVRFWAFADAPQTPVKPYAVWQTVAGVPANYLSHAPDLDSYTVQVDCYADASQQVRDVAKAIRDAIQSSAHITGWRGESRDPETMLYRYSFDVEFHTAR